MAQNCASDAVEESRLVSARVAQQATFDVWRKSWGIVSRGTLSVSLREHSMRFHWKKESFHCHLDEIRSISVTDTKTRKKELSEKVHIMIEFKPLDLYMTEMGHSSLQLYFCNYQRTRAFQVEVASRRSEHAENSEKLRVRWDVAEVRK